VPALKAMALDKIGDIANPTLTENTSGSITWETASDWDNAVDESGVVHENFGDRTASRIDIGYPSFDRGGSSLVAYWPFDEDSGSTANDVTDNGHDGTITGVTIGATGIFGSTSYDYDGTDDIVEVPDDADLRPSSFTANIWFKANSSDTNGWSMFFGKEYWNDNRGWVFGFQSDGYYVRFEGPQFTEIEAGRYDDDTWHMGTVTYDGSTAVLYIDGGTAEKVSGNRSFDHATTSLVIGARHSNDNSGYVDHFPGELDEPRFWSRALSDAEVQALWDAQSSAYLTSDTKSFASTTQPDLTNLDYALNGESITVDVIGSPGTTDEETVSQALDGATSYDLTWSNSHTDFRLKIDMSTTDITTTSTFSRGELKT
jgi:hypothetical protein